MLVTTGFESHWDEFQWHIWPCLILTGLPGDKMNRHNLPLTRHAATDMSSIGWTMIAYSSNCLISPGWLASTAEGDSMINATLLYLLSQHYLHKCKSSVPITLQLNNWMQNLTIMNTDIMNLWFIWEYFCSPRSPWVLKRALRGSKKCGSLRRVQSSKKHIFIVLGDCLSS